MNTENQTIGINVDNLPERVDAVSPVPYQMHQMMDNSISTPDLDTLSNRVIRLTIDEDRLVEQEDKVFLAQLKEYHGRRFSDEW